MPSVIVFVLPPFERVKSCPFTPPRTWDTETAEITPRDRSVLENRPILIKHQVVRYLCKKELISSKTMCSQHTWSWFTVLVLLELGGFLSLSEHFWTSVHCQNYWYGRGTLVCPKERKMHKDSLRTYIGPQGYDLYLFNCLKGTYMYMFTVLKSYIFLPFLR